MQKNPSLSKLCLVALLVAQPFLAPAQAQTVARYELRAYVPTLVGLSSATATTDTSSLTFANTLVGQTSLAQSVTVTNSGQDAMQLMAANVMGAFASSTNCGSSLAGGASCTFNVTFKPTAMGTSGGSLSIPTSAGTRLVTLVGTGLLTAADAGSSNVDFGNLVVGSTSNAIAVTLNNSGNTPVSVTGVTATGAFAISHNCPATLAGGSSCTANVTFTPAVMGPAVGSLKFATSAGDKSASLLGMGQKTDVSLSTTAMTLDSTAVGATSASQSAVLTNTGNTPLAVSAFSATGPFSVTSACGATLAAGANCSYNIAFKPTAIGAASGTLSIPTEVGTKVVTLASTGLLTNGYMNGSSLSFGNQAVGSTSSAQSVTLTNDGNVAFSVSAINVTGAFAATQNCPATLTPGASCTVNVTYSPLASGASAGQVSLTTGAGTKTIALSGTGTQATADIGPLSLDFGNVTVPGNSAAQIVTLTNNGNANLTVGAPSLASPFVTDSTCGTTLAAGTSCAYSVKFSPGSAGAASGSLSVPTSAGTKTVSVTGFGIQTAGSTSVTSLSLASTNVGATSAAQSVTLSNTGNTAMAVSSLSVTGPFAATHNCGTLPASLAASATCTVNVTFSPVAMGAGSGTLSISTAAGMKTVSLSGTGLLATADLGATTLAFGNIDVASTSASQAVTLTNNGNTALSITAATLPAPFSSTSTCGATLAAAASCSYNVTFSPTVSGAASSTLTITTSAGVKTVTTTGTGQQAVGSLAAASGSSTGFGTTTVGGTVTRNFVFTNTGNATATGVYAVTSGGELSLVSNNCGTVAAKVSVPAAGNCTYSVLYSPLTSAALVSGSTQVVSSATNSPSSLALTGGGAATSYLLGFDGANGSSSFVDAGNTGGAWTSVASAAQSTTFFREGTASLSLNGVSQAVVGPAVNLVGDFTVSAWMRPTATPASFMSIVSQWSQTLGGGGWTLTYRSTGAIGFSFGAYSEAGPFITSSATVPLNQWTQVAVSRTGSNFTLYVNGVVSGSASYAGAGRTLPAVPTTMGNYYTNTGTLGAAGANWFAGNIDDVRISVGANTAVTTDASTLSGTGPAFSAVTLGATSSATNLSVTNSGATPVTVASVASTGSSEFVVTNASGCTGATLAPGATCSVAMTFTPSTTGVRTGTATVTSTDASNSPFLVGLSGTGAAATDPSFASVAALFHFDGTNGSTVFTDVKAHTAAAMGAATISTTASKFGGASVKILDSTNGVAVSGSSIDLTGSYTVETWVNVPTATTGDNNNVLCTGNNVFPARWVLDLGASAGSLAARIVTANNATYFLSSSAPYTLGTWAHVAYVNDVAANTFTVYINGSKMGSRAGAIPLTVASTMQVGKNSASYTGGAYYLDDVRITQGLARYTTNFSPPTAAFPNQ